MTPRQRYFALHADWISKQHPQATTDHGAPDPIWPQVNKSNGMTQYILNFLKWSGHRATRINTTGALMIEKYQGQVVSRGYRPSSTRRGTADISATVMGRSVMLEIKAGSDTPSPEQLTEQIRERAAGGVYEFIYSVDGFLEWYDGFILSLTNNQFTGSR